MAKAEAKDYFLDLDPNVEADIFKDYTGSQFEVSKEERGDIWEKTKKELGPPPAFHLALNFKKD